MNSDQSGFPITGTSEFFIRPALQRLFCAVGELELGETGNACRADIRYLDRIDDRVQWVGWEPGHVLHWHPFKLRLHNTARAGLHITSEWRHETDEMRYGANFKIRKSGIFVLNPSNVLCIGEELLSAMDSPTEREIVDSVLLTRFGLGGGFESMLRLGLPAYSLPEPRAVFLTH